MFRPPNGRSIGLTAVSVFEHNTFEEIVTELNRYYNVNIRFMDEKLRQMRFSGDFRVEDGIYHIMSMLQLTYKFNYTIVGKGY